jgi:flavin-dependent dehydrogenase
MSVMRGPRYDVAVIGGGPAGTTCAIRLAQFGFQVVLLDNGERRRQHLGESIPSSSRVLFETLGVEPPPDVVVARPPEHRVYWGSMEGPSSTGGEGSMLVWRGAFDAFLKSEAARTGVDVREGAVRPVQISERSIHLEGTDVVAAVVVDASGRSGLLAREDREREGAFRTLAITAHFRGLEEDHTLVESFADGWVWSAPLSNGLRDVTLMVDADRAAVRQYDELLARTTHARAVAAQGERVDAPRGVDATPYHSRIFCGENWFLVGDAGSFLDPLSAHGTHKAMDSALAAAAAIRTILERPARTADACAFYDRRESEICRVTGERLRALYAQERRFAGSPFWEARSCSESERDSAKAMRPMPPVGVQLRSARGVEVIEAPVLENDFVERREVLVAPSAERPVRFLGPFCLPAVYRRVVSGEVSDEDAPAVEWLFRHGYLDRETEPRA